MSCVEEGERLAHAEVAVAQKERADNGLRGMEDVC